MEVVVAAMESVNVLGNERFRELSAINIRSTNFYWRKNRSRRKKK